MTVRTHLGRVLAAAALVAAAVGVGAPTPARAAAPAAGCSSASGVTVVVDFNELGGGVASVCDGAGGGKDASQLFPGVGLTLKYASRMPGFVCRVNGVPTSDPCVNTSPSNAFWGLWWSDGKTGKWSYSSLGTQSLTIPDGGYVAFSWDQSDDQAPPSFTPATHAAPASPTPKPSPKPTPSSGPGQQPGGPGGGRDGGATGGPSSPGAATPAPTDAPSASAEATPTPPGGATGGKGGKGARDKAAGAKPRTTPTPPGATAATPAESPESPEASVTDAETEPAASASAEENGVPTWLVLGMLVAIFGATGAVVVHRRRTTGPPAP